MAVHCECMGRCVDVGYEEETKKDRKREGKRRSVWVNTPTCRAPVKSMQIQRYAIELKRMMMA
jgi:hypothetical protein